MSPTCLSGWGLLALLALAGCGPDPEPPASGKPESASSRPAGVGGAPDARAIVVREGDHVAVIVDVPATDARGRKVERAALTVEPPAVAIRTSEPVRTADGLALEIRVPLGTPSVTLAGTSEGGAAWSQVIRTDLGAK